MTPEQEASDPATPPERLRQMVLLAEAESALEAEFFEVVLEQKATSNIWAVKHLRDHLRIDLKTAVDLSQTLGVVHRTRSWARASALADDLSSAGATVRVDEPPGLPPPALSAALASNRTCPADVLERLARGRGEVQRVAARNPNTPRELWLKLGERYPQEFTENPLFSLLLLEDPSLSCLSTRLVFRLFDLKETRDMVLSVLLGDPARAPLLTERLDALDDDETTALATHPTALVRRSVAGRLRCTSEARRRLLVGLLVDEEDWIRAAARTNPEAPREVIALLRRAGARDDLTIWQPDRRAPDLGADEVERLAALGPWGKQMADRLRPLMLP